MLSWLSGSVKKRYICHNTYYGSNHHSSRKTQLSVLNVILREMKIPFETAKKETVSTVNEEGSLYDPEFVNEILQAKKNIANGKGKALKTEDLWK